ncbi:MAG: DMT family transporter [Defluviitaleaceae bacterium]|nr:DMT family transporter [Defluviitaleaceae bacterium]MCL2239556.1 DMT family transporter [Defluviitaleaceae bacterium]
MYYFLALLTGIFITTMVTLNGGLTAAHGLYSATVMIHGVGFVVISAMLVFKREWPFTRAGSHPPLHLYLGGAIGVATVLLTNYAFGSISVSALLALGLFGQSLTGIAVDQFGLFGMKKYPFNRRKLLGLSLMLVGIGVMVLNFGGNAAMFAAVAAFASGISIVMSRVFNARLATYIGTRRGVFFTHIVGLAVTIPLLLLLGRQEVGIHFSYVLSPGFYLYLGGLIGVCVITLDNFTAVRIPAFYLALLLFVGQVSSGLVVDFILDGAASPHNMIGGALVALGLCVNVLLEKKASRARQESNLRPPA